MKVNSTEGGEEKQKILPEDELANRLIGLYLESDRPISHSLIIAMMKHYTSSWMEELMPLKDINDNYIPLSSHPSGEEANKSKFEFSEWALRQDAAYWKQRCEAAEELLFEIDESLYIGEDLNDADILKWIDVVTIIKDDIKQFKKEKEEK